MPDPNSIEAISKWQQLLLGSEDEDQWLADGWLLVAPVVGCETCDYPLDVVALFWGSSVRHDFSQGATFQCNEPVLPSWTKYYNPYGSRKP